jgi:hypothetical protein
MDHEILIPISFFVSLTFMVKFIVDNRARKLMIEKGAKAENIQQAFADHGKTQALASMKWGMVLTAVGIAIFLGRMFSPFDFEENTIALMLLLGGLALILYYAIAARILKNS